MVFGLRNKNLARTAQRFEGVLFYTLSISTELGSLRRIVRRLKIIWLSKPKGRPPIHENVIDLILEMKRCNQNRVSQRISDEFQLMHQSVQENSA